MELLVKRESTRAQKYSHTMQILTKVYFHNYEEKYMIILYSIFVMFFLTNCQVNKDDFRQKDNVYPFYVGTYTDKESEGIYKYILRKNGHFNKIGLVAKCKNPAFLAKSADNKYLLAVNEIDIDGIGFVESFLIKDDTLTLISNNSSGGAHPCFITVNQNGFVLVANYTGGNVGLLRLNTDGQLSKLLYVQNHIVSCLRKERQVPLAHSAWFNDSDNSVISVDKGTSQLWFSQLDTNHQKLLPSNPQTLDFAPGSGPRHLAMHPNGHWIYVLNELDNTVTLVKKSDNGKYIKEKSFSTLPTGFTDYSISADIKISSDGKFIYASNRGHNSIATFKVNTDNGELNLLGLQPTFGDFPRNISLSPDENYLVVANRNSNNIVSFKRDKITGLLIKVDQIYATTPACILF